MENGNGQIIGQAKAPPQGFCPLASTGTVIIGQMAGKVQTVETGQVLPIEIKIACMESDCQWWSEESDSCIVRSIGRLRTLDEKLSGSYIHQALIDALIEKISRLLERTAQTDAQVAIALETLGHAMDKILKK